MPVIIIPQVIGHDPHGEAPEHEAAAEEEEEEGEAEKEEEGGAGGLLR